MKIHILEGLATETQVRDMLESLGTYIKVAVDIERGILAGGGEYHADCEEALLQHGSRQEYVWGADWYSDTLAVSFGALINIRPSQGNPSMEIRDPAVRRTVEAIVRRVFGGEPSCGT